MNPRTQIKLEPIYKPNESARIDYFSEKSEQQNISIICKDVVLYANETVLKTHNNNIEILFKSDASLKLPEYDSSTVLNWLSRFHPINGQLLPVDMSEIQHIRYLELCDLCCDKTEFCNIVDFIVSQDSYSAYFISRLYNTKIKRKEFADLQRTIFKRIMATNQHDLVPYINSEYLFGVIKELCKLLISGQHSATMAALVKVTAERNKAVEERDDALRCLYSQKLKTTAATQYTSLSQTDLKLRNANKYVSHVIKMSEIAIQKMNKSATYMKMTADAFAKSVSKASMVSQHVIPSTSDMSPLTLGATAVSESTLGKRKR